MKKIIVIILTVVMFVTIMVLSVGAVSHNNGEAGTGEYLPWLNYTITAETDTSTFVLFDAPVLSTQYPEVMQTLSEYDSGDFVALPYIDIRTLGLNKITGLDLYRTTMMYKVPDFAIDDVTPIETVGNTVIFDPFSVKVAHAFDSQTLKISDVIGSFNWYGLDIVDTTIMFKMGVRFSYPDADYTVDRGKEWRGKQKYYELEFVQRYDGYFWSTDDVDETTIAVRNVTDGTNISYVDFVDQITYDGDWITDDLWVDIENLEIDFTYIGAGTAQFVHQNALYATRDVYNDANSMFMGDIPNAIGSRQKYTAHWMALQEALNGQHRAYNDLWVSTEGGTIVDGVGDKIAQMVSIFAKSVGAVLDVDLFGVGITLGHITLVALLGLIIMIYLRFFAGG